MSLFSFKSNVTSVRQARLILSMLGLVLLISSSHLMAHSEANDPINEIAHDSHIREVIPYLPDDGILADSVTLDGITLYRLRGISIIPASERVRSAEQNILDVAKDSTLEPTVTFKQTDSHYDLYLAGKRINSILSEDAELEGTNIASLRKAIEVNLPKAVHEWRLARTNKAILKGTALFFGISLLTIFFVRISERALNWVSLHINTKLEARIALLQKASREAIQTTHLSALVQNALMSIKAIFIVLISFMWLNVSLGLFPWTSKFSDDVFKLILDTLSSMGTSLLNSIPGVVFLVILFLIVRFILKVLAQFFHRLHAGYIQKSNFDKEWALPTYRILRVVIIVFSVIVAYPYIPGSSSEAFKGVSIFLGLLLSFGSSSFIANIIAGYTLVFRSAFKVGDRVKIAEHIGDVVEIRAQSVKLRTIKNEDINIPNSLVTSSSVVNYSKYQHAEGVILHVEVGLGYDVPWRQAEALLLKAANATVGVSKEPKPFVLQLALTDFTVTYQLNVYCGNANDMAQTYSRLYQNTLDVFNEYEVQIMSPNYESDPVTPKFVGKDDWFKAPADPNKTSHGVE